MSETEIASPVSFTSKLDRSEALAIERRLAELEPYVAEAAALKRRLINVHRRLGVESRAAVVDRQIVALLTDWPDGLARSVIVRELAAPEHIVKASLERCLARGQIRATTRGHYKRT